MKTINISNPDHIVTWITVLMVTMMIANGIHVNAQEAPPRPISVHVNPAQGLVFGAFFQGATGGSVIVHPDGSRSVTGDLIQANLGAPFSPALFEVDANPGTVIAILNGPNVTLTGNHGGTLLLQLGTSSVGSQFVSAVVPPERTQIRIGGTLKVGNALANPAGEYSGSFSVIFIQQ